MKIKTFTYDLTKFGKADDKGCVDFIDDDMAHQELNGFIRDKDVIDIKVNTYEARYHNNGGVPLVRVLYTIMYKEDEE